MEYRGAWPPPHWFHLADWDPVKYTTHNSPTGRAESNHIAMINLEPFGSPEEMEQVWLSPPIDRTARLTCIPFRAYGLAFDDLVRLDPEETTVIGIAEAKGHQVFRIIITDASAGETKAIRSRIQEAISKLSLRHEWATDLYVAIDIPPGVSIDPLEPAIQKYIDAGKVFWEWGHVEEFRI